MGENIVMARVRRATLIRLIHRLTRQNSWRVLVSNWRVTRLLRGCYEVVNHASQIPTDRTVNLSVLLCSIDEACGRKVDKR